MSTTGLTFATDADGVVYRFEDALRTWFATQGITPEQMPALRHYDIVRCWPFLRDQGHLADELAAAVRAGFMFRQGAAYRDAVIALRKIHRAGHRIVVLTARNLPGLETECLDATRFWFDAMRVPYDDIILTADKHREQFDLLVDDYEHNVAAVLQANKNARLLNRVWNRNITGLPKTSWGEVPELLNRMSFALAA